MESRRHAYNIRVRQAGLLGEEYRNKFLVENMAVLAPFIKGAKRSLQVAY